MSECSFLADKAYDVKAIYNTVHDTYNGDCFIALNNEIPKALKSYRQGISFAKQDSQCIKTASFQIAVEHVRNTAVR